MREIKFRQAIFHPITKEFSKWHYWGLIDRSFIGVDTGWFSPTEAIENSYQYTGLKDKNGIEIYEGDNVRYQCNSASLDANKTFATEEVYFGRGAFILRNYNLLWSCGRGCTDEGKLIEAEVIGNVYENPSLIDE